MGALGENVTFGYIFARLSERNIAEQAKQLLFIGKNYPYHIVLDVKPVADILILRFRREPKQTSKRVYHTKRKFRCQPTNMQDKKMA